MTRVNAGVVRKRACSAVAERPRSRCIEFMKHSCDVLLGSIPFCPETSSSIAVLGWVLVRVAKRRYYHHLKERIVCGIDTPSLRGCHRG